MSSDNPQIDSTIVDTLIIGRVEPHIYAFVTDTVPAYLKVGDTYRPVEKRIKEWKEIYKDLTFKKSWSARIDSNTIFRDHAVHSFLENTLDRHRLLPGEMPDIPYYSREFFKDTSETDVTNAIEDIKNSAANKQNKYTLYTPEHLPKTYTYPRNKTLILRDMQADVVNNFAKAFDEARKDLLMYAVMRFGKSVTAMSCAVMMNAKRILVVSAKADVKNEWKKTVESYTNFKGYTFANKETLLNNPQYLTQLNANEKVVLFLTLQDLQGEKMKNCHQQVFKTKWDLMLVDETHFAARADHYGAVIKNKKAIGTNEGEKEIKRQCRDVDTLDDLDTITKTLKVNVTIHLSGTPYRILMGGEFTPEDVIAFVQFSDIADAKAKWEKDHRIIKEITGTQPDTTEVNEWDNPYYGFPQMIRFAFRPNEASIAAMVEMESQGATGSFAEVFRPRSINSNQNSTDHKRFIHEDVVLDFLKVIDGSKNDSNVLGFLDNKRIKDGKLCRHIVFVLPYCASCDAMEELIKNKSNAFRNLGEYEIINISGIDIPKEYKDIDNVTRKIEECEKSNKKTITLTVNRMLTGSTVPQWDTMIYLKNTTAPEEYDQAIFRLQNPYVTEYKDENDNLIKFDMKPQTILVDFEPERMFRLQERKSQIYNLNVDKKGNTRLAERLSAELKVSPIIMFDHNKLREVTPTDIIDAVRNYEATRSVMDEALDMPTDLSLIKDEEFRKLLNTLSPIDPKKGLSIKANEKDDNSPGDDINPQLKDDDIIAVGSSDITTGTAPEKVETESIASRLAAYYARILFFAFLTDDKVKSLEQIIDVIDSNEDNKRIAFHLNIEKRHLADMQAKINGNILSRLDRNIHNLNQMSHDKSLTPEQRATIALTKFGRMSDSEVVTPAHIADEMVAMLPENPAKYGIILDIASKQGEFAAAINRRYKGAFIDRIYSVCTSGVAYELTRKMYSLLDLPVSNVIRSFTTYELLEKNNQEVKEFFENMKISTIIGNPPYHEGVAKKETLNGQKRSKSIFNEFQLFSERTAKQTTLLIYPGARWIHRAGKGMNKFGYYQINDRHLSILKFYPDSEEVFKKDVGIADGISIVLKDLSKTDDGFTYMFCSEGQNTSIHRDNPGKDLMSLDPAGESIVVCLRDAISRFGCLHDSVLSQKLFSIESDFVEKNPSLVREYNTGDTFDKSTEIKLFTNDKAGKSGRSKWYVTDRSVIQTGTDHLDRWKVVVSSANAGGQKRSNQIDIFDDLSAFGRSRVALKTFETEREAENFLKYATSEVIKYAFLLTDESLTSLAKLVPDIRNYKDDNGLINFNDDINHQLYKLFKINAKEQHLICKTLAKKAK